MRPMDVSITTVGPLGWIRAAAVAWGASGRAGAACAGGGVDCCAVVATAEAAVRAEMRIRLESFIPCLRVNHAAGGLPEAGAEDVSLSTCIFSGFTPTSGAWPWPCARFVVL